MSQKTFNHKFIFRTAFKWFFFSLWKDCLWQMIVLASDWARKKKLRKENIRVVWLTWPGRSLVEIGRLERNPGPTISASLHSITVPSLSNLTLNFFSPLGKSRAGLDLMAATTPGRQNPSTHLTVTLAPIIDLFGILFVLAMSAIFSLNGRRPRVSGRSAKSVLLPLPRTLLLVSLLLVGPPWSL